MLARSVRSNLLFNSARWIHRTPSVFSTDRQPGPSKQTMLAIDWQLEGLLPKLFKGSLGAFFQRMSKDVEFDDHIFNYKIKDPYNLNIHLLKMEDSSLENFNAEETAGEEDAANQPEEDKNLLKPSEKEVKEHLKDGTWKLKLWTNGNVNGFSILVQEDNKTKWRVCNVCNAVYSTRSTPSMRSHWANHSESRKDEPHEETLLLEAATKLVVEDGRSFRTIDTPSFKDYTSTVAKLAVQLHLKNRAFESIKLPTSYDVAKNLEVDYEKAKQEFRQKRLPIAVKNGCAITFDFSQESVDFAVATLHFLDNEWNITSQILEFAPFPLLQSEFETETGEVFARKSIVNIKEKKRNAQVRRSAFFKFVFCEDSRNPMRAYYRYKSPYNSVEYLGSTYFEGEEMLTVLWRLTSLKSSFLRYFPKFVTGKAPEYQTVDGALDIYVGPDDRIYKMINRPVTPKDVEQAQKFSELKKESAKEVEQKERDLAEEVAKKIAEEKRSLK
ncbi:hypothetical protein M3Y97_00410200 [Aphelenchoides bicaudatus]|nr:hypothetical protein M3Y97_00410200 [Aphelenchoides bicaudatus]